MPAALSWSLPVAFSPPPPPRLPDRSPPLCLGLTFPSISPRTGQSALGISRSCCTNPCPYSRTAFPGLETYTLFASTSLCLDILPPPCDPTTSLQPLPHTRSSAPG